MSEQQDIPAFKSKTQVPPLTNEEMEEADKEMNIKFRRVDRKFADPIFRNQVYSLHSFLPAKGATPDKDGFYGVIKFRGAFQTEDEAQERCRYMIKNVDSYNPIITGYVGRPMPLVADHRKYCSEKDEVELNKKTEELTQQDLQDKRIEDKKTVKEIKEKEQRLLNDVENEPDPQDAYTTLRVKRSQLIYTYNETIGKLNQMFKSLEKCDEDIEKMDKENPEFKKDYMERYLAARDEVGLEDTVDNFMKYLGRTEPFNQFLTEIDHSIE